MYVEPMQQEQLPETARPEKRCGRRTALLSIACAYACAAALGGCSGKGSPDPVKQRAKDAEPYMKKAWWEQQGMEEKWSAIFFRLSRVSYEDTVDSRRYSQEQWDSNERIAGWMQENHIVDIMVWNDRGYTEYTLYVTYEGSDVSVAVDEKALMDFAVKVAVERYPWLTYPSEWKGNIQPVSGERRRRQVELRYTHDLSLDALGASQ
ncbi:MAG TPA: hypothetical protein VJB10_00065 [Candidatus Peribacteraceae bacterium]|nr:hypothetical protein [Candidatus Peribacteraceae bacterium]